MTSNNVDSFRSLHCMTFEPLMKTKHFFFFLFWHIKCVSKTVIFLITEIYEIYICKLKWKLRTARKMFAGQVKQLYQQESIISLRRFSDGVMFIHSVYALSGCLRLYWCDLHDLLYKKTTIRRHISECGRTLGACNLSNRYKWITFLSLVNNTLIK